MKFGAWPGSAAPWQDLVDECQHAERTGWDGVWVADHFMPDREDNLGPVQEVWTVLAGLAALVPRVRLGSLVSGNTYRNPAVLAKEVAQVDIISGGRVTLGIGAGWQQSEHLAYDLPFYTVGTRLARLSEAVQIIRSLFKNDRTNFEGKYYKIKNAPLAPKPIQKPLPILIGGGGEKVTLRIVAAQADVWNTWGTPDLVIRKSRILDEYCEQIGRDPKSIRRTAQAVVTLSDDPAVVAQARERANDRGIAGNAKELQEQIARYAEARVDEFILPNFNLGRAVADRKAGLDRFIQEVAAPLR